MPNLSRYDRQIRLFGHDTQRKIFEADVLITSKEVSYLAGEIFKDLLLLGCNNFTINKNVDDSIKLILFDEKEKISDAKVQFTTQSPETDVYIRIFDTNFFFCRSCLSFSTKLHTCESKRNEAHLEMLLGGVFVQEMVKWMKGDKYVNEHILKL